MKFLARACLAAAALAGACGAMAADFDPRETFAPFSYPQPVNAYRSGSGMPGPMFWQNRADYELAATLDPVRNTLSGKATIRYTNNSPDALDVLWLQLDENRFTADARGNFTSDKTAKRHTDGYRIASVTVDGRKAEYVISDTRMQVRLPAPLAGKGGKISLTIVYSYDLPGDFGGRTGFAPSKNGNIYEMAQWYPRMCVYDDLRGWDTAPYLNSEFYLEYGDFDYAITVPSNMIVAGSGELVNPDDVLTATQRERLAKARQSDSTVMIRTPAEVADPASRPKQGGTLTWKFRMKNTRDVAFGASTAYVWDAARINLPEGKTALAMSVYPVESVGQDRWGRSTEYLKAAVEHFSSKWYPYPYPVAINEAGTAASGMEYPGIVFDPMEAPAKPLHMVTAHEIGHTWFPMIVGSDERRNAWMDEGFNTFIDVYEADAFNHGEFAPKRDGEYAPKGGNPVDEILPLLADRDAPSLMIGADMVKEKYRHPATYFKAALGLVLLREEIIGPERFDPAFRKYIATWAYRHPSPSDFFRLMESEAGEDLSWFWRGWFEKNWQLDMAVEKVDGSVVTVANLDQLVMPATLRVTLDDKSTRDIRVPVETWQQHKRFDIEVPGGRKVVRAEIDPDHKIPDRDRGNNKWPR
ncbi:M1 family metallopeptidase [Luteibacter jiangsuensis]|uniref:M1 family metallopeptidase n=1 Tax=Luteibacter jiangsuensis TaxID=637577 RepID=A0ABX0PZ81_9GAMM|nr:M1 family metallopeptidase [Luteibacter jiangsuensis]NID03640.1 M1 family metallopeptidase [Luteibacter jiangsuensis]